MLYFVRLDFIIIIIMWVIRIKRLIQEQALVWRAYTPLNPRSADPGERAVFLYLKVLINNIPLWGVRVSINSS